MVVYGMTRILLASENTVILGLLGPAGPTFAIIVVQLIDAKGF
jgi:hypothetical protein